MPLANLITGPTRAAVASACLPVSPMSGPVFDRMLTANLVERVSILRRNSKPRDAVTAAIAEASSKNCSEMTNRMVTQNTGEELFRDCSVPV
jgi:hypothetical protein